MSRNVMDGDGKVADADHLAVGDLSYDLDRWKPVEGAPESELRIIGRVLAAAQCRCGGRAGDNRGAGKPLQRRDAAAVIEVSVRHGDQLDVFGLESNLADVGVDERGGLRQPAIKQDVAGVAGNEQRRQAVAADVVRVAKHAKRLARLVPRRTVVALVRRIGHELRLSERKQQEYGCEL